MLVRITDTGLCGALRAMRILELEILSKNEKWSRKRREAYCPLKGHTVLWPIFFRSCIGLREFKCSQRKGVGTWYMSSCMGIGELLRYPFWQSGGTVLYERANVEKMTKRHSWVEYGTDHGIEISHSFRSLKKTFKIFVLPVY